MGNETTRYRQDDAFGQRSAEERHAAEDPLAELARLMGQDDEFAALARTAPRPAAPVRREPMPGAQRPAAPARPAASHPAAPHPAAPRPAAPAPRPAAPGSFAALAAEVYSDGSSRPAPRSERHALEDAARDLNRGFARSEPRAPEARAPEARAPEPRSPEPRSYVPPRPQPTEPRFSAPSVDPMSRGRAGSSGVDAVSQALSQSFAAEPPMARGPRAAEPAPPVARAAPSRPAEARPVDLDEEAYDYGRSAMEDAGYGADGQEGFDERYEHEEVEDTAPRSSRRLAVIGTVVGLVVIGAAGLYAFRSSGSGPVASGGQPPVIRADDGPNKVVPEPSAEASTDGQKLIYDRVGGNTPTGNERVVSSEEQPVDVSQAAQPQPRVIQPATGASPTPVQPNSTEPKRVRTLTVRADGSIVEDATPAPVPGAPTTVTPMAQPTTNAPIALSAGTAGPINTDPTPLSATPSIVDNMTAPAPRAPTPTAAAPTPAPAAAAPVAAGAYVVQIASVRSEAEAQSTWRAWQAKYPGILGGQQMNVRRADLGDRGVYYRAQVGSFANREDANALCQALRAQGGDCMVQRN